MMMICIDFNASRCCGSGFEEVTKGCCGSGILEAGPLGTVLSGLCRSPNKYMFFDSFHPSERVYREITNIVLRDIVPKLYEFQSSVSPWRVS